MTKYTTLLLISLLIACNSSTTQNSNTTTDTTVAVNDSEMRSASVTVKQYESFLLYSKAGQDQQIKNLPNVKNPEKNWYQIRADYAVKNSKTHLSQLDTIRDVVGDGFSFVKTGRPAYTDIKAEYLWVYNTPTTPPTIPFGIYMTADTIKYRFNVNVFIDSCTNIYTKESAQWGFYISSNVMRNPNDPNHYQSVQTQKL